MDVTIIYPLDIDELKKVFAEELAEYLVYKYVNTDPKMSKYHIDLGNLYVFIDEMKKRITEEILKNGISIDMNKLREKFRYLTKNCTIADFSETKSINLTDKGIEIRFSLYFKKTLREALNLIAYDIYGEIIEKYRGFYEKERDAILQSMNK